MEIAILMSTYNGEKYLRSQIDSILKQNMQSWHLFIRDDGSNDQTISIIEEYEKNDSRISLVRDEEGNRGVVASFIYLLLHTHAELYFFCDQDDVWMETKLSDMQAFYVAHSKLPNQPVLIYSDFQLIDSKDEIIETTVLGKNHQIEPFERVIFNDVTGCTMMINESLAHQVRMSDAQHIVMHDWWFALIASVYDGIYYFPKPEIGYRQHGGNVVGADGSWKKRLKKIKAINLERSKFDKQLEQTSRLIDLFGKDMNTSFHRSVSTFIKATSAKKIDRIKWLLKNPVRKPTLVGSLVFYFFFTRGRSTR